MSNILIKGFPDLTTPISPDRLNQFITGWIGFGDTTVTFFSWDSTVSTAVVTISANLTGIIGVGDKLKYTHGGLTKYAIVTAITSTTMTLFLGTDYILSNTAMTDVYFSKARSPFGFPINPDKWSIKLANGFAQQYSPVASTVYNLGGNYVLPIGVWKVEISTNFFIGAGATINNGCKIWVASTNSSSSSITNKFSAQYIPATPSRESSLSFLITDIDAVSIKTTRFINILTFDNSYVRIGIGINENINIKAVCAYL